LVREFTCMATSADLEFVYVGTTGGEMLVLMRRTNVFRSIIPVCSNALTSICVLSGTEDVLCGGGDGSLHRLNGRDMAWRVTMQASMDSHINNISLTASETEAIVVCASGAIYRYNVDDFRVNTIVCDAHTAPVRSIVFVPDSTIFITGTSTGTQLNERCGLCDL
jgi:WD40 repeat protein